ncbi:MAG: Hsp70 family protein [Candidatus Heimdallarchaeota archaeon]|nr:Hsp70 family protein [Candidatus Heimdallarchaeota archaeon]
MGANDNSSPKFSTIERRFWNTFLSKIPNEKHFIEYKKLLFFWSESSDIENRKKLFDVAVSHENYALKKYAMNLMTHSPPSYWKDYVMLWINRPVRSLQETIKELIENRRSPFVNNVQLTAEHKALKASVLLLFDEIEKAESVDNEFFEVEKQIRKDPLMYSHIDSHLKAINKRNLLRILGARTRILEPNNSFSKQGYVQIPTRNDESWRALRGDDLDQAWRNMLNGSFACIVNYIGLFTGFGWKPKLKTEREIFEILYELVGYGGWKEKEDILFTLLNFKTDITNYGIKIRLNPNVYSSPNLFSSTLITDNMIRADEPFYDPLGTYITTIYYNEIEILQIEIPKGIINKLSTIEQKSQLGDIIILPETNISISLSGITAIITPSIECVFDEMEWIVDSINILELNHDNLSLKMRKILPILRAFQKLFEYHSMKNYELREIKNHSFNNIKITDKKLSSLNKNEVIIGMDFGNNTTAISILDLNTGKSISGEDFVENKQSEIFTDISTKGVLLPSVISYQSGNQIRIGQQAIAFWANDTTFKEMKKAIRAEYRSVIRVEGRQILAPEATKDFLITLFKSLDLKNLNVKKIAFSYPVFAPAGYQTLIQESLSAIFKIPIEFIFSLDEATSACIGMRNEIKDFSKSIIVVDIGGGTTDIVVLTFDESATKEINSTIYTRENIEKGGRDIDTKIMEMVLGELKESRISSDKKLYQMINDDSKRKNNLLLDCQNAKHVVSKGNSITKILNVLDDRNFKISRELIEELLEKSIYQSFSSFLRKSIDSAKFNGSPYPFGTALFVGGGFQWEGLQKIARKLFPTNTEIITKYNPYAVAKGVAEAAVGLNVKSNLPFDLGLFKIRDRRELFELLFSKIQILIPMKTRFYQIKNDYNISNILLEIGRYRQFLIDRNEMVLVYDSKNTPRLIPANPKDYIEPLGTEPIEFPVDKTLAIEISSMGEVIIASFSKEGKQEQYWRIGRAI